MPLNGPFCVLVYKIHPFLEEDEPYMGYRTNDNFSWPYNTQPILSPFSVTRSLRSFFRSFVALGLSNAYSFFRNADFVIFKIEPTVYAVVVIFKNPNSKTSACVVTGFGFIQTYD